MSGVKHDKGKTMMALLEPKFLQEVAEVLTFGAAKYGVDNWKKGLDDRRVYSAILRHLNAWRSGEFFDEETGLSHLSHATCGIMFLHHKANNKENKDEREEFDVKDKEKGELSHIKKALDEYVEVDRPAKLDMHSSFLWVNAKPGKGSD